MQTIKDLIKKEFEHIEIDLNVLLNNYSSIGSRINDDNPDIFFISPSGDRSWNQVSNQGKQLQSKVYKDYNHVSDLIYALICNEPKEYIDKFNELKAVILECIEQNSATWYKNSGDAFIAVCNALQSTLSLLDNLYSNTNSEYIFVVDTSALVYNPNIEEWSFEGIKCMTLAIPPTVISELDSYEMSNKNENVKEKARKLINKFKEYSRRGNLASGVTLVKNKINLFTLQQEPDMSKSLSHLNYQNNDDRIFASFIEVIRTNVNSTVILVSRDFNLHNKANHFSLPVFDPPTLK